MLLCGYCGQVIPPETQCVEGEEAYHEECINIRSPVTIMWKLLKEIVKEDEGEFTLETNDFFRPNLKQIGNSVFDIRNYYIPEEGVNIIPTSLETPLKEVKERLLELFDLCAFNLIRHDSAKTPVSENAVEGGFAFISKSLAPVLDIPTSSLANHIRCDVFIALPGHSVLLLTLVEGDSLTEALEYNMSVARGVTRTLSRFMDECVHPVHGVLPVSTLYDKVTFEAHINKLATQSSHFITKDSLLMNSTRYFKVLNAFWAGVAETKCVKTEPGKEDDDSLRFLTREQCIVLVENINNNDVQVMCGRGTGASTLMLEVARRLSRLGDTLLVCKSEEERDRLRKVYTPTVTVDELSTLDLSPFTGIVDETNETETDPSCSHWRFTNIQEELKNLKMRTTTIKREVDSVKGQIAVLENDEWEGQMNFLFEEMDVLRMFSVKVKHVMTGRKKKSLQHSPFDDLSSPECDGQDLMANRMKPLLVEFKQRIYGQNDVLHSIKEFLVEDKILIDYFQTKIESWKMEQSVFHQDLWYDEDEDDWYYDDDGDDDDDDWEYDEDHQRIVKEWRQMQERREMLERRKIRKMQERRKTWERRKMRVMRMRNEENVKSLLLRGHNRCSETAAEENFASLEDMNKGDESKEISEGRKTSFSPHSNQSMDVDADNKRDDTMTGEVEEISKQLQDMMERTKDIDESHNSLVEEPPKSKETLRGGNSANEERNLRAAETQIWLADMAEQEEMLSTLEKERDLQKQHLHSLYSVLPDEWLTKMHYLHLHKDVLSLYGIELPEAIKEIVRPGPFHKQTAKPEISSEFGNHERHLTRRSQIFKLRLFQQGLLKERDMLDIVGNMIVDDENHLASLQALKGPVYLVGPSALQIVCPELHLDAARAPTDWYHVTKDGELVNSSPLTQSHQERHRLQEYCGTCASTPIPYFHPTPLSPQYTAHLDTGRHSPGCGW
ncbi:uncharacterized protein LOC124286842 isoform X2 [Haliotis rubra]|uniref:uncharacterized protein LOC124286842 isoform X2 n=1 Tax=Haliotis rubra TaxID=36100 RepID=UPI001EE5554D|nr:uncharacterized protein LOC124286842 isoform X2 [Haliotis rubra]